MIGYFCSMPINIFEYLFNINDGEYIWSYLLCAMHVYELLTCINSFNPHDKPMKEIFFTHLVDEKTVHRKYLGMCPLEQSVPEADTFHRGYEQRLRKLNCLSLNLSLNLIQSSIR